MSNIEPQTEHIPEELLRAANDAIDNSLPNKSLNVYEQTYAKFTDWMAENNTNSFSETVFLAYFNDVSKKIEPSSLWPKYSMLKKMLITKKNIDISTYGKLRNFIKKQNVGFNAKKSKIFTSDQIKKFLLEAPDDQFLDVKAITLFGLSGACRRKELFSLKPKDVVDETSHLTVTLRDTKTNCTRVFTIDNPNREIILHYHSLRPKKCDLDRYFLRYENGRCINQPIGINMIGKMPSKIAQWLRLPEFKLYTGHSFRRTSATLLADSGASITILKRHGGWRSTSAAEGYLEDSISNKRKVNKAITGMINEESCDTEAASAIKKIKISINNSDSNESSNMNIEINNCAIQ